MRGYKGKNGEHGRHGGLLKRQGRVAASIEAGRRHGGICLAARRSAAGQGFAADTLVGAGRWCACSTVLVPLGSLAGRTECRSRCSRRAPHEPLFRIRGPWAHGCCAPIPSPRPVRHSHTRPSAAGALGPESAARASPPLSARLAWRLAASGRRRRANAAMLLHCCCSPSSCACNAALSGRPRACSCCTSIANTQRGQSAPAPPAYAPSATRRVPSFHTRFDHARSGLIDRQPITSLQSVDSARLSFQRIGDADSSNAT